MQYHSTFTIGSYVRIKHQAVIGQVVRINRHKACVAIGAFHFYLPLQAIERAEPLYSPQKKATQPSHLVIPALSIQADPIVDLHGFNRAQALFALEKFLDRALLLGYSRLKIIHGQGTGILRRAVRDYLHQHPLVKRVIVQSPIHCMAGMTIVEV